MEYEKYREHYELEEKRQNRCETCRHARSFSAAGWGRFLGCTQQPYKGKWVIEIEFCPLMYPEKYEGKR